ncbi:hypothetical protein CMEL01_16278, partial [Colletotrichum melonis]
LDHPPPLRLDSTARARDQGTREALRRTPLSSRHTAPSRSEDSVSQLPHPIHPARIAPVLQACTSTPITHPSPPQGASAIEIPRAGSRLPLHPAKHHISPTITTLLLPSPLVSLSDVSTYTLTSPQTTESRF